MASERSGSISSAAVREPRHARTAALETRDPSPLPRLDETVERVESAKITGLAQRAIERRDLSVANRLIVLAGEF